jgi:hypothetical protein
LRAGRASYKEERGDGGNNLCFVDTHKYSSLSILKFAEVRALAMVVVRARENPGLFREAGLLHRGLFHRGFE